MTNIMKPATKARAENPGSDRWHRAVVVFALVFISEYPDLFNSKNRASGLDRLAGQLNTVFQPPQPFLRSDVRNKIELIWSKYGHNADESSDKLYEFGVHCITLPGLENDGIATFDEVRAAIEELKWKIPEYRKLNTRESVERTEYVAAKLRGNLSAQSWVIECSCPFDTENGCRSIQCENCKTWQHVFCYYERHIDLHYCNNCSESSDNTALCGSIAQNASTVLSSFAGLALDSKDIPDMSREELTARIEYLEKSEAQLTAKCLAQQKQAFALRKALDREKLLSTFTTFGSLLPELNLDCGPTDAEIRQSLNSVRYWMRQIIVALPTISETPDIKNLLTSPAIQSYLAAACQLCLTGQTSESLAHVISAVPKKGIRFPNFIMALTWAMICDWVLYSDLFNTKAQEGPFSTSAVKVLWERDGANALHNLQLEACKRLTDGESPWFESMIQEFASDLSTRCSVALAALMSLLNPTVDVSGVAAQRLSKAVHSNLEKIFAACVRLKGRLPLRNAYFEIFLPAPGTDYDISLMDLEIDVSERAGTSNQQILNAKSPVILCHPRTAAKESFLPNALSLERLNDCILRRDDQRGDETIVVKASVVLLDNLEDEKLVR